MQRFGAAPVRFLSSCFPFSAIARPCPRLAWPAPVDGTTNSHRHRTARTLTAFLAFAGARAHWVRSMVSICWREWSTTHTCSGRTSATSKVCVSTPAAIPMAAC